MEYNNEFYVTGAQVGKPAPKFKMNAVMPEGEGVNRFNEVSLDEYLEEGKWVVLYFYPLDFTFVCPTEIKRFNTLNDKFETLGAKLIAVSTDSVFSHLAWQDRQDLGRLNHVHASDNNGVVSEAYGIYDEEKGISWRGTFIISPDGELKSVSVNHGEAGRNVDEVLRLLEVFKNESEGKLVPCGWNPGEDFL